MSFICLLQADDSAKTLNLLDKRQQQLHIQKEFDELEKKQQQEKDVYLENQDSEDKIYIFKQIQFKKNVGGKIKCRKRKIKCRIFATNYLSFNLKLKL